MSFLVYLKGIKCKISHIKLGIRGEHVVDPYFTNDGSSTADIKVSTSVSLHACGFWKTMERQYGR